MPHDHRDGLDRIAHRRTIPCLGDGGDLSYQHSRRSEADVDRTVETVLQDSGRPHRLLEGSGWAAPAGRFRFRSADPDADVTPHGEFDRYHTLADSLERISPTTLEDAVETCPAVVDVRETNRTL